MVKRKLYKVLALDGGGVRGMIPIQILQWIESKIRLKTNNPEARIIDYFDMVAGTSIGAVTVALLVVPSEEDPFIPKYSIEDVDKMFMEWIPKSFSVSFLDNLRSLYGLLDEKYPADNLEAGLYSRFKDLELKDLLLPTVITSYDVQRRHPLLFTRHEARKHQWKNFLVRDMLRASTAAPVYFEVSNIQSMTGVHYPLIDGGIVSNNPSLLALSEARSYYEVKPTDLAILSLGTGIDEEGYHYQDIKDFGSISWTRPLLNFIMSSGSETVDYFCKTSFEMYGCPEQYLRLNALLRHLPPEVNRDIADASDTNLEGYRELGSELAQTKNLEIDRFIDLILDSELRSNEEKYNL